MTPAQRERGAAANGTVEDNRREIRQGDDEEEKKKKKKVEGNDSVIHLTLCRQHRVKGKT